ncbi:MAG: sulfurtransferase TusA family protein [Thiotrichales bacterium]|nr:sulfurtransferase TusA family protein [Thiotrichales bacterium]
MGLFGKSKPREERREPGEEVTLDTGEVVVAASVVDCIGDNCPRPQILTRKALAGADAGEVIEVKVDNPTSMEALPPIIEENGGAHLGTFRRARHWQVLARKG